MPLWLIHLLAAATALALAEHWLRYALVERKRARRVAARLERIRRGREQREREADAREWSLILAGRKQPRLAESLHAQMQAEQMRAMQGVGALGAQEAQLMAIGLNPAGNHVLTAGQYGCQYCRRIDHHAETCQFFGALNTGTGPFPAPDTWHDPLLDGPRGVTARGAKHG